MARALLMLLLLAPACQQVPPPVAENQPQAAPEAAPLMGAVQVVRLRNADANALAPALSNILPNRKGAYFRLSMDYRTNSLLLSGSPDQVQQALDLIAELDIPLEE